VSRTYPTDEAAFKRVETLRRTGIWPGVIKIGSGKWWRLTWDPDDGNDDQ